MGESCSLCVRSSRRPMRATVNPLPLFYGRKTASGQGARVPPPPWGSGALSGTGDGGGSGGGARRPVQRPAEGPRPGVLVSGSRAVEPPCVTLQVLLSRGAPCTGPDGEGAEGRAQEVGEPPPEERREDAAPSFAAVPRSPHRRPVLEKHCTSANEFFLRSEASGCPAVRTLVVDVELGRHFRS